MNLPQAYLDRMRTQLGETFPAYLAAMDEPEKRAAQENLRERKNVPPRAYTE